MDLVVNEASGTPGMKWIPAATFWMGCDIGYPEEKPVHRVGVDGFWIDRNPVTNAQFAEFIEATAYISCAEIPPDPRDYPGAQPEMLQPGSLVFSQTKKAVDLADWSQWWTFKFGANWRRPYGPESDLVGREDHPVVHVAYADALAFAGWAGKDLPTEAEWELAARGGLDGATFAWGDIMRPDNRFMANTWQGQFPWKNTKEDGWEATSPVGSFPPNGYGLVDMIGNVWEWTQDWYVPGHPAEATKACCIPQNPRGPSEGTPDPHQPEIRIPRKVLKGGSFLCAPNFCRRYRPAARHPEPVDTSTCHVGFRCVKRPPSAS